MSRMRFLNNILETGETWPQGMDSLLLHEKSISTAVAF